VSLRVRLLLAVSVAALIGLVVADVAIYRALRSYLYDRVDTELDTSVRTIAAVIDSPGTVGQLIPGTFVQVRDANGVPRYTTTATRLGHPISPVLPDQIPGLDAATQSNGRSTSYFTTRAEQPDGPSFRVRATVLDSGFQVIVATPLDNTDQTLHRLLTVELLVTGGALVAAVALGASLVGLGLRPLARMEETADAIVGGDALDTRVPGETERTEVGRLARSLNTMLGRLQVAFAQRDATEAELRRSEQRLRRFVADASHELRTPLAAVSAYAELYDRAGMEHEADRPRMLAGIRSETARMGRLVEDLLLLARLDEGQPLEERPVQLLDVATEAVDAASAVGPDWPIRLECDRPVEVLGDPARLRQVLDNLLANARAHTAAGTPVTVRVGRTVPADGSRPVRGVIEVADEGPGLAADDAARVFERFYRTDESRSRRSGGTGLGLAIVAAIVDAHGGEVALRTSPGHGARFTIELPLAHEGFASPVPPTVEPHPAPAPQPAIGASAPHAIDPRD
jgi:two-component system OmpR family sensor kinase